MPPPRVRPPAVAPAPFGPVWTTPAPDENLVKLYHGNVTEVLAKLPEKSVHCCVTSPPYWGLRDYGVEGQLGSEPSPDCGTQGQVQCGRCFVCAMVAVFRGVRRVLRDDGTLWLNLGDSYGGASGRSDSGREIAGVKTNNKHDGTRVPNVTNLPSGNLVGVPWRVALALQADGWILRQDVIWHKPAPMPESVTNRCTKAHEYVFLLAKRSGYFYDAEAVKEKSGQRNGGPKLGVGKVGDYKQGEYSISAGRGDDPGSSNKRSVWSVSSQGYPGAHFATYPPKLIEPMILAGTSAHGCCGKCGAPWKRLLKKEKLTRDRPNEYVKRVPEPTVRYKAQTEANPHITHGHGSPNAQTFRASMQLKPMATCGNTVAGVASTTLGWEPGCDCFESWEKGDVVPCVVLDPFMGSGTTAAVAVKHGRGAVGIDLNAEYIHKHQEVRVMEAYVEAQLAKARAEALAERKAQAPPSGLWS